MGANVKENESVDVGDDHIRRKVKLHRHAVIRAANPPTQGVLVV